ncbi:MAG TPA: Flp pilus assembly protein CpaB [Xanthobacteraceae bacterium]|nr:Flp pilus assembly protein CpaB [Xanthobacteraceae bacterium]
MLLRVVLLIGALGAGGVAAWLVVAARPEPVTKVVESAPATQDVLVAAADLLPAQTLTKENLRWQSWPQSALNPIYLTRTSRPDAIDFLAGSIIRNRMAAGEPIREENFTPRHAGYLATVLPSGKRAMAVRISAESTAGGFILPNDRVDVLHSDGKSPVSHTILSNVRVLAIDQVVDDANKNDTSKANVIGKTATLELDPSQAEILTAAQAAGTLSLSLRSAADNDDYHHSTRQAVRIIRAGHSEILNTPF